MNCLEAILVHRCDHFSTPEPSIVPDTTHADQAVGLTAVDMGTSDGVFDGSAVEDLNVACVDDSIIQASV